jgi:hypothetical protein
MGPNTEPQSTPIPTPDAVPAADPADSSILKQPGSFETTITLPGAGIDTSTILGATLAPAEGPAAEVPAETAPTADFAPTEQASVTPAETPLEPPVSDQVRLQVEEDTAHVQAAAEAVGLTAGAQSADGSTPTDPIFREDDRPNGSEPAVAAAPVEIAQPEPAAAAEVPEAQAAEPEVPGVPPTDNVVAAAEKQEPSWISRILNLVGI